MGIVIFMFKKDIRSTRLRVPRTDLQERPCGNSIAEHFHCGAQLREEAGLDEKRALEMVTDENISKVDE
jgi:hypothetical protein